MGTVSRSQGVEAVGGSHDASHDHEHHRFQAHHFGTMSQQMDSNKLGMWLFLATEVLLFGGLFAAYAIYRARRPEVFEWGHVLLDWKFGALNTVVLLFSSLTMALAVRAAQLSQRKLLISMLALTIGCGLVFMCVKYVEYTEKFAHNIFPGVTDFTEAEHYREKKLAERYGHGDVGAAHDDHGSSVVAGHTEDVKAAGDALHGAAPSTQSVAAGASGIAAAARQPPPVAFAGLATDAKPTPKIGQRDPANKNIYFGIYYAMTGLHGLHVLIGMGVLTWVLVRSVKGHFDSSYYAPVEIGGLYWHLVDLIWIFLFPLLYLVE